jgi:hypothetical protein
LTGASSLALKGVSNSFGLPSCAVRWLSGRKPVNIERLASAEAYFRALADGLKT